MVHDQVSSGLDAGECRVIDVDRRHDVVSDSGSPCSANELGLEWHTERQVLEWYCTNGVSSGNPSYRC